MRTAHLDILGYRHIAVLAEGRYYADATRSIEYGPLAGFFNPKASLDPALCAYFAGFQQIVSYIYDPDGLFESGLRRAGVKNLISASPKIREDEHAARQLARPLEQLALWLEDPAARIFPSSQDLAEAQTILSTLSRPLVAIHPGSGGERKNWPLERWQEVQRKILDDPRVGHLLIIGGESDSRQLAQMRSIQPTERQTILGKSAASGAWCRPFPMCIVCRSRQRYFSPCRGGGNPLSAAVRSHQSECLGAGERGRDRSARARWATFEFGIPNCPCKNG